MRPSLKNLSNWTWPKLSKRKVEDILSKPAYMKIAGKWIRFEVLFVGKEMAYLSRGKSDCVWIAIGGIYS